MTSAPFPPTTNPANPASPVRTVAIVGAGWSGLQIAAVLRQCGLHVTLYEALDDVGGTWHPANAYAGLSIHTPSFRCGFEGFDNYRERDPLHRLPSQDVFENCRAFAREKGLLSNIRFRHVVVALRYDTARRVNELTVRDLASGDDMKNEYDFVVSTQFNTPRLPSLPGRDGFAGEVLHANALNAETLDRVVRDRLDVVVLGGSKSATDVAMQLVQRHHGFTWLLRRMYWFLSYDKGYYDFERCRPSSVFHRLLYFVGLGLARGPTTNWLVFTLWRLTGLLQCPGRPHGDYTKFHHGWLDEQQVRMLRTRTEQIYGEVERLDDRHVVMRDGRRLPCDVLVCATGCDPIGSPIALCVDSAPIDYRAVEHVYRFSVIPELPSLCFTGYAMFGFGPLNGYHRAAWILRFIEQGWSTETLRDTARRESAGGATFMFRDGSFLFDSSGHLLLRYKKMSAQLAEGLYSDRDVERHYFDMAVRLPAPPAGRHQPVSRPPLRLIDGAEIFSIGGATKPSVAFSTAAAIAMVRASWPSGPSTCTPHGKPAAVRSTGAVVDGRCRTVAGAIHPVISKIGRGSPSTSNGRTS